MEELPDLLLLYTCLQALPCPANKPTEKGYGPKESLRVFCFVPEFFLSEEDLISYNQNWKCHSRGLSCHVSKSNPWYTGNNNDNLKIWLIFLKVQIGHPTNNTHLYI